MNRLSAIVVVLIVGAALVGCGGGSSSSSGIVGNSYFPLNAGRTWTYSAGTQSVVWTARGQATFQGTTAYELDMGNGLLEFFNSTSSGLVNLGEDQPAVGIDQSAAVLVNAPGMLAFPTKLTTGYTWTQQVVQTEYVTVQGQNTAPQTTITTTGTVVGVETITVPAGTYTNALHVRANTTAVYQGETTTDTADNWYVPGIGLIMITDANATPSTIVLASYTN